MPYLDLMSNESLQSARAKTKRLTLLIIPYIKFSGLVQCLCVTKALEFDGLSAKW